MVEAEVVDVHYQSLGEWLVDRRVVPSASSESARRAALAVRLGPLRERVDAALLALQGAEDEQRQRICSRFAHGYLHGYHCARVRDMVAEADGVQQGRLWTSGQTSAWREWRDVADAYRVDAVHLAEAALLLVHAVEYEIPALRRAIARGKQAIVDFARKRDMYRSSAARSRAAYRTALAEVGLDEETKRDEIEQALAARSKELPAKLDALAASIGKTPHLAEAIEHYTAFVAWISGGRADPGLVVLRAVMEKGNISVYQLAGVPRPATPEQGKTVDDDDDDDDDDGIDFGDDDGGIDFGICLDIAGDGADPDMDASDDDGDGGGGLSLDVAGDAAKMRVAAAAAAEPAAAKEPESSGGAKGGGLHFGFSLDIAGDAGELDDDYDEDDEDDDDDSGLALDVAGDAAKKRGSETEDKKEEDKKEDVDKKEEDKKENGLAGIDFGFTLDIAGDAAELDEDGIDFGDDSDDADADFGITVDVAGDAADIQATKVAGVPLGQDELHETVLFSSRMRNVFISDVKELEAFLMQRIAEAKDSDAPVLVGTLEMTQLGVAQLEAMLGAARDVLAQLEARSLRQLIMIQSSTKFLQRLARTLAQNLETAERLERSLVELDEKEAKRRAEVEAAEPKLAREIASVEELKRDVEEDLSARFKGHKIRLIGAINALQ